MPFPGTTFLAMMGWPLADAATLNGYSGVMLHGVPGVPQEEVDAARGAAAVAFQAYIADQIAQRRAEPTDDVTTAIMNAEIDGALIPDSDLYDVFVLMMMAGLDTVQSVLAQSMTYLAQHPDQWNEMFACRSSWTPRSRSSSGGRPRPCRPETCPMSPPKSVTWSCPRASGCTARSAQGTGIPVLRGTRRGQI